MSFDALVVLSFGGPEAPEDVIPFLENVLRGRPVPRARLEQVAEHYMRFGGRSPINDLNRDLAAALRSRLAVPVYWGNRHWHPFLAETVARMRDDGVGRAAVFATSAYSSYSGCRQYLDDIDRARATAGPGAPELVKIRPFWAHPGFTGPLIEGLMAARAEAGPTAPVLMSAHSIPTSMAAACDYEAQLRSVGATVAAGAGVPDGRWQNVYQSRSGPPAQPWLGPDVLDVIAGLPAATSAAIVVPIGFVSDHMEVVYDLDTQAREAAAARGIRLLRSPTPGPHPDFLGMVAELFEALPGAAACRPGCCPAPALRPPSRPGEDEVAPAPSPTPPDQHPPASGPGHGR